RTQNGWSGPSAIGTGGLGAGLQAGAEISELVIVLNTPAAVDAFAKSVNVTLGGALGVAAGPIGRTAEGAVTLQAATYTYSRTQGLFAGISIEGTVISTRDDLNEAYYGKPVDARDILAGKIRPPADAQRLLDVLAKFAWVAVVCCSDYERGTVLFKPNRCIGAGHRALERQMIQCAFEL